MLTEFITAGAALGGILGSAIGAIVAVGIHEAQK